MCPCKRKSTFTLDRLWTRGQSDWSKTRTHTRQLGCVAQKCGFLKFVYCWGDNLFSPNYPISRSSNLIVVTSSSKLHMQGDIQQSGQVYTHPAPWDKSESVSLLEAVLIYCRSQMPPLDPRDFRTEDMKHVVPLVNWPLATVVRDVRDCTRRYTRMRTVWKVCVE